MQLFAAGHVISRLFFYIWVISYNFYRVRGSNTLYLPYFCDESPANEGKGRSDFLIQRRDRKLILRYYYHTWLRQCKYDDTISQLSFEFDIAERTIQDRLMMNSDLVAAVMEKRPPLFELKKEIPYFNW